MPDLLQEEEFRLEKKRCFLKSMECRWLAAGNPGAYPQQVAPADDVLVANCLSAINPVNLTSLSDLLYYGEETNNGNCDVVGMPAAMEKEQECQAWERNALLRMVRLPTFFEPMSKMLGLRPSVVLLASPASSSPVTTAAGTSIPILLVCFLLSSVAFNPNVLQTCLPPPRPAHTPSFLPRDSRQTESDPAITTRDKTFCSFDQGRRITLLKSS